MGPSVERFVIVGAPVGVGVDVGDVNTVGVVVGSDSLMVGGAVGPTDAMTVGCKVGFCVGTGVGISTIPAFWHISMTLSQSQSLILVVGHEKSTSGGNT